MIEWIIELLMKSIVISSLLSTVIFGCIYMYKKNKGSTFQNKVITFIFIFYIICLLYITIYRDGVFMYARSVNIIPFHALLDSYTYLFRLSEVRAILFVIYNVIGNIAWFIPFGFFLNYFIKKPDLYKVLTISFALSFTIEIIQFIACVGISDIDDLIFNTLGGCIGYGLYHIVYRRYLCQLENR